MASRTSPNRSSMRTTRQASATPARGVASIRTDDSSESRPGHSMPTMFEMPASAATTSEPSTRVRRGNIRVGRAFAAQRNRPRHRHLLRVPVLRPFSVSPPPSLLRPPSVPPPSPLRPAGLMPISTNSDIAVGAQRHRAVVVRFHVGSSRRGSAGRRNFAVTVSCFGHGLRARWTSSARQQQVDPMNDRLTRDDAPRGRVEVHGVEVAGQRREPLWSAAANRIVARRVIYGTCVSDVRPILIGVALEQPRARQLPSS